MDPATLTITSASGSRHRGQSRRARSATPRTRAAAAPTASLQGLRHGRRMRDRARRGHDHRRTIRRPRPATATRSTPARLSNVAAPGLLANDSDPDAGDRIQARLGTGVSAGNLLLRSDGSFTLHAGHGLRGHSTVSRISSSTAPGSRRRRSPSRSTSSRTARSPSNDAFTTARQQPADGAAGRRARERPRRALDGAAHREARPRRVPRHRRIEPDGSFVYTPDKDFVGTDTFRYVAVDVQGAGVGIGRRDDQRHGARPAPYQPSAASRRLDGGRVTAPIAGHGHHRAAGRRDASRAGPVTARNVDRGTPVVLATGSGAAAGDAGDLRPDAADQRRVSNPDHGRVVGRRHWRPARPACSSAAT